MDIEPLGCRALIRKVDPVVGGSEAGHAPVEGIVIAVGENSALIIGCRVLIGRYAGMELVFDGAEHVIVDDSEVVARVRT